MKKKSGQIRALQQLTLSVLAVIVVLAFLSVVIIKDIAQKKENYTELHREVSRLGYLHDND